MAMDGLSDMSEQLKSYGDTQKPAGRTTRNCTYPYIGMLSNCSNVEPV
jgi:hypothetical protein